MQKSDGSPLLLVWQLRVDTSDATSIQLRRMMSTMTRPIIHLYTTEWTVCGDAPRAYFPLMLPTEPQYRFRFGGGVARRLWRAVKLQWLVRSKIRKLRKKSRLRSPRVAYVVCYEEWYADYVLQLLGAAGVDKFVLHVFDLHHPNGRIDEGSALGRLVQKAETVRVVSSRMADQILTLRKAGVEITPLWAGRAKAYNANRSREPILMMSGTIHSENSAGMRFLQHVFVPAWKRFKTGFYPAARWVYAGTKYQQLPAQSIGEVEDLGLLSDLEFSDLVSSAYCALLPVNYDASEQWRFSFPSRLTDLLTAGLPTITASSEGTATGDFVAETNGYGIIVVRTIDECVEALKRLFLEEKWYQTQRAAALVTAKRFDPDEGERNFRRMLTTLTASTIETGACKEGENALT
jgi:hypothetical protein